MIRYYKEKKTQKYKRRFFFGVLLANKMYNTFFCVLFDIRFINIYLEILIFKNYDVRPNFYKKNMFLRYFFFQK